MKAAALALLLIAAPAHAEEFTCGAREVVVTALTGKHQERVVGNGLTLDTNVFEVWASPAGTWTLLVTNPQGRSCVIGVGTAWESIKPSQETGEGLGL